MPIDVACPKCSRRYKLDEKYAGKKVKCTADGCRVSFQVPGVIVLAPVPVATEPAKAAPRSLFKIPTLFAGESDEVKLARIAAKEAEKTRRRAAWSRFWFQVRLAIIGVFACFVGLVALAIYAGRNAPRVSYVTPSVAPSPSVPAFVPNSTVIDQPKPHDPPKPHHKNNDGSYKEGLGEKVYEKITGKEVVHKKDGTTYERNQPKKK